jgi:hypothetical protein
MTALEKSRSRRYASAADFAEDLRRARTHLPIRARRAPPWIRLAHWCRRNPEIAGLTGVIVLFLTAAAVSIGFLLAKSSETRGRLTAEIDRLDTEIAAGRLASAEESLRRAHTLGLDAQTAAPYLERIESLRAEEAQRNAELPPSPRPSRSRTTARRGDKCRRPHRP